MDYGCDLGVTDVSLDGCLSVDPASVAGGVGTGGRDRGSGKRPCDVGGAGHVCWVAIRHHGINSAADGGTHVVGDTTCRSTSVPYGMTDS